MEGLLQLQALGRGGGATRSIDLCRGVGKFDFCLAGELVWSIFELDVLCDGLCACHKAGGHRRVRRSGKKQECDTLCAVDVPSLVTPDTKAGGTLAWGERRADCGLRHRSSIGERE